VIERIGNYRITDEIGSGGMAVVYKGVQESLRRAVAIKALKTSVMNDRDVVARFEREATSIASFQHENIITVYDFFRERGALFIVMEYVEGIDLYDLLDRHERLPSDIAAIISLQVARALDYAHFCGVIHRDVKPANIIISKLGTVKLTDFGIARVEQSDLTEFGVGLGTPAYMSPEQVIGGRLDHRSDIFSLGIVMYQMVTGRKPFVEDEHRTAMEKIREDTPERPRAVVPQITKPFEEIILRCMEKEADDRFSSTQALVVALEQYLAATVSQNYRARLLLHLKDQQVLSQDETMATLHPALIGEYMGRGRLMRLPRRLRWRLLVFILLLIAIPIGMVNYWYFFLRSEQLPGNVTPCIPVASDAQDIGYLRVLAHPWARVEIDGKPRITTPFDRPLPLPAGKHRIRLLNPYFETVAREVKIDKDKVVTITEVLERRRAPPGDGSGGGDT
jgi:serine/threonine-protein kinase